jgi:cytoskeleton protein RodZ
LKTVGQILSSARAAKNLTLEEVEASTKIRKKTLLDLERGSWKDLPSPTFVKGLIRNYGRFLGLDERELLAFYRREVDESRVGRKISLIPATRGGLRLTPQIVTVGIIILFVLAVVSYLFFQYRSFTGAPLLEVSEPGDNIKVTSSEINLIGRTWDDAELKVNGQQVQVSPGGAFSLSLALNPGLNTITVTAANKFGKISTVKRTVVVDNEVLERTPQANNGVNLVIRAGPESANIIVDVDGTKQFDGVLIAGSEVSFSGEEQVRVESRNAGSTTIVYNGVEEVLGKSGESAQKTYQKTTP